MRKGKFGLRIRIVDGRTVIFTLKYPAKTAEDLPRALKIRHEHEVKLPLKLGKAVLRGDISVWELDVPPVKILRRHFSKSDLAQVRPLGVIETKRTVVPLKKFELEIDYCRMFDQRFYEVEIETTQPKRVDKAIRDLFHDYDVPYRPLTRSKLGRFLQEWKKRQ